MSVARPSMSDKLTLDEARTEQQRLGDSAAPQTLESETAPTAGVLDNKVLMKALIGGCVGNFLEWFDFALFGLFATEISETFFPPASVLERLLCIFVARRAEMVDFPPVFACFRH